MRKLLILFAFATFLSCSSTPLPSNTQASIANDFTGVVHAESIREHDEFLMLRELGVRWALATFYWSRIEHQQGAWDFASYDDFITRQKAAGNKIVAVLAYDTPWIYPDNKSRRRVDAKNLQHFLHFVEVTVKRYRDTVDVWQIWNEPNGIFWKGSRADYLALHAETARTIRAVKKDAFILGGAFWRAPASLTNAMFKYGAFDDVDAISFHPYGFTPAGSMRLYDKMRRLLARHNFQGEIWITEAGYPTGGWYPNRVSETESPSYIIKTMAGLAARGARTILWYELFDSYNKGKAPSRLDSEAFFGLLYPDFTRKEGAEAFSLCARFFAGSEYQQNGIARPKLPASLVSFYFKRPDGGGVLVLWNDALFQKQVRLEGLGAFTLHNITSPEAERKDGAETIAVGKMPVFISWSREDQRGAVSLTGK